MVKGFFCLVGFWFSFVVFFFSLGSPAFQPEHRCRHVRHFHLFQWESSGCPAAQTLRGSLRCAGMVAVVEACILCLWHITTCWAVLCCPHLLLDFFHKPLSTNCCTNYCICAFVFAVLLFVGQSPFSLKGYWPSVLGMQILLWLGLSVYQ